MSLEEITTPRFCSLRMTNGGDNSEQNVPNSQLEFSPNQEHVDVGNQGVNR